MLRSPLLLRRGALHIPLIFRKQQWLVVAGATNNVHDFDGVCANAIENQIIAEWTSADAEMFVARHQGIAARCIGKRIKFFRQLSHKFKCHSDARISYLARL